MKGSKKEAGSGPIVLPKNMSLRQKIEFIQKTEWLTDYRISKDTGVSLSSVQKFRDGVTKVDNIRLDTALKYEQLFDKMFEQSKK